jgi:hypothetical protein
MHALSHRIAEASQILLRDVHVLPQLFSYEKYCRRDRWSRDDMQSVAGVSAVYPLVAFYDIHARKREMLLFFLRLIWRRGENTRLLRKKSRVRFPHCANICVHEHVYLYWVWVFLCIICMYLQKKMYISMY